MKGGGFIAMMVSFSLLAAMLWGYFVSPDPYGATDERGRPVPIGRRMLEDARGIAQKMNKRQADLADTYEGMGQKQEFGPRRPGDELPPGAARGKRRVYFTIEAQGTQPHGWRRLSVRIGEETLVVPLPSLRVWASLAWIGAGSVLSRLRALLESLGPAAEI